MAERPEKGRQATPAAERKGGFGVVLWITLVIIAAVGGAAGAWVVAYERGLEAGIAAAPPPIITAEAGPTKVAPEDEGGLEVPNQEAMVFDAIDEGAEAPAEAALAPPPEEPVEIPPPEPPSEAELAAAVAPSVDAAEETMAEAAEGAGAMESAGEMAEEPGAVAEIGEAAEAVEEEVLLAPEPETLEEPREVASAAQPADPEPLRIEADGEPEAIVLEPPPEAAMAEPAEPEMAEPEMAAAEMAEPTERSAAEAAGPRVQLAAFRSPERAEIGWGRIVATHEDLLGGLDHRVVRVDLGEEKGIFHRLQTGPMADAEAAKALCESLQAREQGCLVVAP